MNIISQTFSQVAQNSESPSRTQKVSNWFLYLSGTSLTPSVLLQKDLKSDPGTAGQALTLRKSEILLKKGIVYLSRTGFAWSKYASSIFYLGGSHCVGASASAKKKHARQETVALLAPVQLCLRCALLDVAKP